MTEVSQAFIVVTTTASWPAAWATASAIAASLGAAPVSRRVTVDPRRVRASARVAVVVAPYPVTRTLLPGARSGRVASSLRRTVVVRLRDGVRGGQVLGGADDPVEAGGVGVRVRQDPAPELDQQDPRDALVQPLRWLIRPLCTAESTEP